MEKKIIEVMGPGSPVKFLATDIKGTVAAVTVRGQSANVQYEVVYWQDGRKSAWVDEGEIETMKLDAAMSIGFRER